MRREGMRGFPRLKHPVARGPSGPSSQSLVSRLPNRITESARLEKTSAIIESSLWFEYQNVNQTMEARATSSAFLNTSRMPTSLPL